MRSHRAGFVSAAIAAYVVVAGVRANEPEDRLWVAAREGDLATIKKLAAEGVDINASTQYGATALSFAADKGHIEVVRFLLEKGADPNKSDTFYRASPMTWASENDHLEVAVLLVEHGAEGSGGLLAKVVAAGRKDLVEKLIKTGKLEAGDLTREGFAKQIALAGQAFEEDPISRQEIPNWARVISAFPEFPHQLRAAVEKDAAEL